MRARTRIAAISALAIILFLSLPTGSVASTGAGPDRSRAVDVVILLDTSGSMEHLLSSVRARIWDVVNDLGRMRPTPLLRVGLVTFGTEAASEEDGFIRIEADLTGDLDEAYSALMAVQVGGSDERVGQALNKAYYGMSWSEEWDALRVVFIAGNESADQGIDHHDFREIAARYRQDGIIINALYAGNREQGVTESWHQIARHGEGNFSAIDPALHAIQTATPQDDLLLELNSRLNETYLPYGPKGETGLANQAAQDGNATRLGVESCSSRIVAKGSSLYTNASWDLVDAAAADDFEWQQIPEGDLPGHLRSMSPAQRDGYVRERRALREAIQLEIQEASRAREAFLKKALVRESEGLGAAMRASIRDLAMKKGFTCDGC